MLFTMNFVAELFPTHRGEMDGAKEICHIKTDSREQQAGSLFVPLVGERFDGHEFVVSAAENGAVAALWQQDKPVPEEVPAGFPLFYVNDTLKALQHLAKAYRDFINPTVIGITGSNGKTTTKDLLHAVLQRKFKTHATIGNFNNEIGMPLTILQMQPDTEVLILEMGMNHFHEIERLTKLACPDYAIITNIGESHIEYLGSREGISQAKLEIIEGLKQDGILFIDGDEPLLTEKQLDVNLITCGFHAGAVMEITDVVIDAERTAFTVNQKHSFAVPLLGRHHAKNASYCIAVAQELGMDNQAIQAGLENLTHSAMRFEQVYGKNGVLLINDAYNASVTSMKAAIDVVKELESFTERIVVLGDILELGQQAKEMHQSIAESIDERIDYVYTYGPSAQEITDAVKKEKQSIPAVHFTDRELLGETLQKHLDNGTVILFKASRMMQFEQFVEACK